MVNDAEERETKQVLRSIKQVFRKQRIIQAASTLDEMEAALRIKWAKTMNVPTSPLIRKKQLKIEAQVRKIHDLKHKLARRAA